MVDTRDLVFSRVQVDYLVRGGARVSWRLFRLFHEPGPYKFKIQVGAAGLDESGSSGEWLDASDWAIDASELFDPVRRGFGRGTPVFYRVVLDCPGGVFTSRPTATSGVVEPHDWLIARELVRQHRLLLVKSTGIDGWLYRRKWTGPTPNPRPSRTGVVDEITGAVLRPNAATTIGTAYTGGYFGPVPIRVNVDPASSRDAVDPSRGSVNDDALPIEGLIVGIPPLAVEDAFVAEASDRRYYVQGVKNAAERRGVPILQRVRLHLAPANSPIHELETPRP